MPDIAITLLVIFGFLTAALVLRLLATAPTPQRVRVARTARRGPRAIINE
ncbi:hypothetical protein [Nocardia sp. NPDC050406]